MKKLLRKFFGFGEDGWKIGWEFKWPGEKKKIEQSKRLYDQAMKEQEEKEDERSKKDKNKLHV